MPLDGAQLRVLVVDDNHNAAFALAPYLPLEDIQAPAVFGETGKRLTWGASGRLM